MIISQIGCDNQSCPPLVQGACPILALLGECRVSVSEVASSNEKATLKPGISCCLESQRASSLGIVEAWQLFCPESQWPSLSSSSFGIAQVWYLFM